MSDGKSTRTKIAKIIILQASSSKSLNRLLGERKKRINWLPVKPNKKKRNSPKRFYQKEEH
jgi:hypothetical protein